MLNIFKGLAVVKDKKYREKMKKVKDDWLNSEITLTSTTLLSKIESSYTFVSNRETGVPYHLRRNQLLLSKLHTRMTLKA